MFSFLKIGIAKYKKKNINKINDIEKLECNCKRKEDQEILIAYRVNKIEAIKNFLEENKYDYSIVDNGHYEECSNIFIFINEINVGIENHIENSSLYYKKACISCETCLGWEEDFCKKIGNNLNEHIQNMIDEHIEKSNEAKRKDELAKKICGIKEEEEN